MALSLPVGLLSLPEPSLFFLPLNMGPKILLTMQSSIVSLLNLGRDVIIDGIKKYKKIGWLNIYRFNRLNKA